MPTRDVARGFEDARTFSQYCEKCEERAPENIGSITPYSECEASKVWQLNIKAQGVMKGKGYFSSWV